METNIVYCDLTEKKPVSSDNTIIFTSTPVSCIDKVESLNPSLIIIRFPCVLINNRPELLELCTFLKKNKYTDSIPVVALIKYHHRDLILKLREINIDYVDFWDETGVTEDKINSINHNRSSLLSPEMFLSQSCPYLIYEEYSDCDEIILCEAYNSRLVINRLRLESLCSQKKHERCDYYIMPRFKT